MVKIRSKKGQQSIEIAPAILVLFVIILFPVLDLLYLGVAYAAGWYENHLACRECACRSPDVGTSTPGDQAGSAAFAGSPLANFIGATNIVNDESNNFGGAVAVPANPAQPPVCKVQTTMTVKPFLPVPWFKAVPGINAPITFTYYSERPQEEPDLAPASPS
ncbi:MAG TPA: hypothetical protein V6C72_09480 [Chroococcales cyanobacterium]